LQRLTKVGTLRRIDRGLYDQPGFNKLTQKPNPSDPRSVIDAVGRRDQTQMLVGGMTAANDLGLTDAVPAKIAVHTDARRRAIKLGNVTITCGFATGSPGQTGSCIWSMRNGSRTFSLSTSSGNSQGLDWMPATIVFEARYTPSPATQSWAAIKIESGANPVVLCVNSHISN
jgi:hypothetical protein